jgi:hypothetical protein
MRTPEEIRQLILDDMFIPNNTTDSNRRLLKTIKQMQDEAYNEAIDYIADETEWYENVRADMITKTSILKLKR